ncbi:tRNA pseudouridine(55) synthase TruB [Candidatus Vesicomyidisocius calyptogenae]|uniref:tRNA pseudouridine synthase B n=1 Tax=Vesicomyosocius okutanii subsp. Calyptogena okutanii (strain HA) TaxID=412965 RepID=A5CXX8_VESOH|nr:tRNA pseudouridine(55) synthase TruB [Candidatus Vesicomyosocius okutanii]BAF61198.1 tRNA pseudouridine synthase B [Candidatus Vesicomyosocius okutanii]
MLRRNPKGRSINGIVLLDKDIGLSSNAALQKVKRLFFAKKAGHTGALDFSASGILPICLGQATKIAQFLLEDDKRYFVRGKLGQISDTGDCEGSIIKTQPFEHLSDSEIAKVTASFKGNIFQIPPMYSALKRDGQPLYKLARKGIEVERESRLVTIYKIIYLGYKNGILSLEVTCSKGTYIRTLIEDIGEKLSCGAHVIELRRTGFAHIDIRQTLTFSELEILASNDYQALDEKILASEDMLLGLEDVYLSKVQSLDIKFGREIQTDKQGLLKVKLFNEKKQFLGIGQCQGNGIILPKKLFI